MVDIETGLIMEGQKSEELETAWEADGNSWFGGDEMSCPKPGTETPSFPLVLVGYGTLSGCL